MSQPLEQLTMFNASPLPWPESAIQDLVENIKEVRSNLASACGDAQQCQHDFMRIESEIDDHRATLEDLEDKLSKLAEKLGIDIAREDGRHGMF